MGADSDVTKNYVIWAKGRRFARTPIDIVIYPDVIVAYVEFDRMSKAMMKVALRKEFPERTFEIKHSWDDLRATYYIEEKYKMFKKWPSIENSYREKFIDVFLAEFPELEQETFQITEKLHGSNVQLFFVPNQPRRIGSRNQWVDEGFYNVGAILPVYESLFADLQKGVEEGGYTLRLFGELFGPGIQKGVDYGIKRILFFGAMIDDELQPPTEVQAMVGDFYVPFVAEVEGLQAALDFNSEFETNLGEGICEGVVIQPRDKVYRNAGGHTFLLKKKNEAFKEKASAKKPAQPQDPELVRLNAEFTLYITENRLQSVFSKHGEIEDPKQIGQYIRLVLADAKEDFLKDYGDEIEKLDKKSQRRVYNVGSLIANMLKSYL